MDALTISARPTAVFLSPSISILERDWVTWLVILEVSSMDPNERDRLPPSPLIKEAWEVILLVTTVSI